ncbi:MAG: DUF448 domain-containing protein [Polyangiaceae bacterium]
MTGQEPNDASNPLNALPARARGGRRARHAGTRTCVGCLERVARREAAQDLIHLVFVPAVATTEAAAVVVDGLGKASSKLAGRGAWLHARRPCLRQAVQRGLARAYKGRVAASEAQIAAQIVDRAEGRLEGLLSAGFRARHLAVGSTVVLEALEAGTVALLLVATDAAAALRHGPIREAVQAGRAIAWGDKARLGALTGRQEAAVIAILDEGIAGAMVHALGLTETFAVDATKGEG